MVGAKVLENKKQKVKELKEKISSAKVIVLANYAGFSVKEITELRKNLYKQESEYSVVKNTILERAVAEAGFADLKECLVGPTAMLLGYSDPVTPLKTLVDFIKEVEKGEIKAGVIEKSLLKKEQLLEVAKLPSREELIAKVVRGCKSPLYGLVNVLQGPIRGLVYALNAIRDLPDRQAGKKGGEQK